MQQLKSEFWSQVQPFLQSLETDGTLSKGSVSISLWDSIVRIDAAKTMFIYLRENNLRTPYLVTCNRDKVEFSTTNQLMSWLMQGKKRQ